MNMADRLLYLLKTRGAMSAQQLAEALDMTAMGARKHLLALEEKGLLLSEERAEGVGRPARYWLLSDKGHARFPDRHADLALQLLGHVRERFGQQGVDDLIAAREAASFDQYAEVLAAQADVGGKVRALAALRTAEGYMAEAAPQGSDWLLLENHCPICAAARECQGFCRSELALFQQLFQPLAEVRREEHLLAGARRCVYRIHPL
ncbi:metalloregulator ArsR/SmtB family transcription factor [uncultured Aquitalea sp.]|uniref:helix-turn-helix transcriptional regulator n=1 Tax=uncultured Aquitalea sp. TaxID=540272 RepID=UPI0025DC346E|nr:metalloregulator ArsR/SmtB family transcription factor [uncultured Aquitalea sp.]